MFVVKLLGSMKIAVKYQVTIKVDNVGAIFMASDITTMCCMKHVDKLSGQDVIPLTLTVSPMMLNRPSTGSIFASLQWSYKLLFCPIL